MWYLCTVWHHRKWPTEQFKSVLIPLHEKEDTRLCLVSSSGINTSEKGGYRSYISIKIFQFNLAHSQYFNSVLRSVLLTHIKVKVNSRKSSYVTIRNILNYYEASIICSTHFNCKLYVCSKQLFTKHYYKISGRRSLRISWYV